MAANRLMMAAQKNPAKVPPITLARRFSAAQRSAWVDAVGMILVGDAAAARISVGEALDNDDALDWVE